MLIQTADGEYVMFEQIESFVKYDAVEGTGQDLYIRTRQGNEYLFVRNSTASQEAWLFRAMEQNVVSAGVDGDAYQ